MVGHRVFSWIAIFTVVLIASCSAPAAPNADPTSSAPPPTELIAAPTLLPPTEVPAAPTPLLPTVVPAAPTQPAPPPTEVPAAPTPLPPTAVSAGPTQSAPGAQTPDSSGPVTLNMDEIFPAGPGRALVLDNCTNCHTFVPIVVLQMSPEQWERNGRDHRDRVLGLTDEEFEIVYEYLAENFNPNNPVPQLPQDLLNTWTSY